MRLKSVNGNRLINKNVSKYIINWDCAEKSKPQYQTKRFLFQFWKNHIVYREIPVFGSRMTLDLYNASLKIAVEIDGVAVHNEFSSFFHRTRDKYLSSIKRDMKKEEYCEKNEIQLIRIMDNEIDQLSPEFFKEKFNIIL